MTPLNVREWLQARRLEGCEYAAELLDLVEGEDEAIENAETLEELARLFPDGVDLCKEVEALQAQMEQIEEILNDYGQDFTRHLNGRKIKTPADKLRAMFESGRWLEHDL